MARDQSDVTPIESRDALVAWLEEGCKPDREWRIGTEHEKFPFRLADHAPIPYAGEVGIQALLEGLSSRNGWAPILDGPSIIGLSDDAGGGAISLEPGGQFELSGAPLDSIHGTAAEFDAHVAEANEVAAPLGLGFLGLGHSPTWTLAETPVMPKRRYRIMADYMPRVGGRGRDMMFRTSTVQVNLDFGSEADMVRKLRVGLALQPVATALFANSPFTEGAPNGFLTTRSEIWRDVDGDRTGMAPWAFEDGMGFERYVDWALDVPMYFVKRGDTYHDVAGASFRDLLAGRLDALPGERATISDWANHLSTLFPEVRLKRYMEMRGADMGSRDQVLALAAFWTGLFYDASALDAAWALVRGWSAEERQALRDAVPREGLRTPFRGAPLADVAREALAIARVGLGARARRDAGGRDETDYLDVLDGRVAAGRTAAEALLAAYEGPWERNVDPVFESEKL